MWKIKIVLRDGLILETTQIIKEKDLQKQFRSAIIKLKIDNKEVMINTANILYIEYYELKNIRKINDNKSR